MSRKALTRQYLEGFIYANGDKAGPILSLMSVVLLAFRAG